jgi:magnesium and cobalt exporter, CNNM family
MEQLAVQATQIVNDNSVDWSRLTDLDVIVRIIVQIFLLGGSAFFSGSEVALFSLSQTDLNQIRRERHPQAANLYALLDQPRRLIISILCGNEFINVAAAANMAAILLSLFDEAQAGLLNIAVMVPLLLLMGEVTPKTVAISDPKRVSTRIVAKPMSVWVKLITPVRWLVRLLSDRLTTAIVGQDISPTNILQADEVRTLVKELQESGELRPQERELIDTLLETSVLEVISVMLPRTQMAFVSEDAPLSEVRDAMITHRHLRIPIYADHRDNLRGFVYAEDLMGLSLSGENLDDHSLADFLHPVLVIPPTKRIDETLEYFLNHQSLAAVVVNEFGGVEGMVTIRNLVEYVFDPITGVDHPVDLYGGPAPGVYDVPGDMKLTNFNELTNFGIFDPRMTTVGGVVFRYLDQLPVVGDEVVVEGVHFCVLEMSEHRIAKVRVSRGPVQSEPEPRP